MTSFKQILEGKGESLIPLLHLTQMLTFIEGAGVEFYPLSDYEDIRKNFIDDLYEHNQIDIETGEMASDMMGAGSILIWLRPTGRTYDIRFYKKDQYRLYYDADGEIESVEIIYSYKKRSQGSPLNGSVMLGTDSWVKIRLTDELYVRYDYEGNKPTFDTASDRPGVESENTLGFIPVRECPNVDAQGGKGKPEFDKLKEQIEAHNSQAEAIRTNLLEFCNNPILTSLAEDQIFEVTGTDRASVAYASGYRTAEELSNERNGFNSDRSGKRLKRVIGGFEPAQGDLFTQAQISPLPPNQLGYVDDKERKLRAALGGTDERGLETAAETRIVFARSYVTAGKKQKSLFTYGLCEIFSMAILVEENLYLASEGQIGLATAVFKLDRKIKWRQQPAYPKSSSDRLNEDIIGRNMARKGVNALEVLRNTFPDRSDQELKSMLAGGLPIEYLEMVANTALTLQGVIDPATGLPMTAIVPMTQYLLSALQYAGQPGSSYSNTDTAGATQQLANRSLDAARKLAEYLGLRKPERSGMGELGEGTDEPPDTRDSEQSLPAADSVVSDTASQPGFFERNFPTFTSIFRGRGDR